MKTKVCDRCGKTISVWHWLKGRPVCADDRLCYPVNKKEAKKNDEGIEGAGSAGSCSRNRL